MSPRNLERILYFALYVVTHIDEHQRERVMVQIEEEAEGKIRRLEQTISDRTGAVEARANGEIMRIRTATEQKVRQMEEQLAQDSDALTTAASKVKEEIAPDVQVVRDEARGKRDEVDAIKWMQTMTEPEYRQYADKYRYFKAQMGAEAVLEIIRQLDLEKLALQLQGEMRSTTGQR